MKINLLTKISIATLGVAIFPAFAGAATVFYYTRGPASVVMNNNYSSLERWTNTNVTSANEYHNMAVASSLPTSTDTWWISPKSGYMSDAAYDISNNYVLLDVNAVCGFMADNESKEDDVNPNCRLAEIRTDGTHNLTIYNNDTGGSGLRHAWIYLSNNKAYNKTSLTFNTDINLYTALTGTGTIETDKRGGTIWGNLGSTLTFADNRTVTVRLNDSETRSTINFIVAQNGTNSGDSCTNYLNSKFDASTIFIESGTSTSATNKYRAIWRIGGSNSNTGNLYVSTSNEIYLEKGTGAYAIGDNKTFTTELSALTHLTNGMQFNKTHSIVFAEGNGNNNIEEVSLAGIIDMGKNNMTVKSLAMSSVDAYSIGVIDFLGSGTFAEGDKVRLAITELGAFANASSAIVLKNFDENFCQFFIGVGEESIDGKQIYYASTDEGNNVWYREQSGGVDKIYTIDGVDYYNYITTAIPEPSTVAMIFGAAVALFAISARRKK